MCLTIACTVSSSTWVNAAWMGGGCSSLAAVRKLHVGVIPRLLLYSSHLLLQEVVCYFLHRAKQELFPVDIAPCNLQLSITNSNQEHDGAFASILVSLRYTWRTDRWGGLSNCNIYCSPASLLETDFTSKSLYGFPQLHPLFEKGSQSWLAYLKGGHMWWQSMFHWSAWVTIQCVCLSETHSSDGNLCFTGQLEWLNTVFAYRKHTQVMAIYVSLISLSDYTVCLLIGNTLKYQHNGIQLVSTTHTPHTHTHT